MMARGPFSPFTLVAHLEGPHLRLQPREVRAAWQSLRCPGPLVALPAQYSLPGGRGVGHQLAQRVAELGEAYLSERPCPLLLGGEAHVPHHLREIPSTLREAHDPGASVRRIRDALEVTLLIEIAQQVVDGLPAKLVARRNLGWSKPVEGRPTQEEHLGTAQVGVTRFEDALVDPLSHRLPSEPQKSPDCQREVFAWGHGGHPPFCRDTYSAVDIIVRVAYHYSTDTVS